MKGKVAVLLDGGFVVKQLSARARSRRCGPTPAPVEPPDFPSAADLLEHVRQRLQHPRLSGHELLRIYFYDAPPLAGTHANPLSNAKLNFKAHRVYAYNMSLQDSLAQSEDVAVRRGEAVFRGWKIRPRVLSELKRGPRELVANDLMPDIEQKGVDLRIGLDVAMLAFRNVVDVVLLVTGDSDLVPAMKLARREGLRVYLDPLGARVRAALSEHADFVFER